MSARDAIPWPIPFIARALLVASMASQVGCGGPTTPGGEGVTEDDTASGDAIEDAVTVIPDATMRPDAAEDVAQADASDPGAPPLPDVEPIEDTEHVEDTGEDVPAGAPQLLVRIDGAEMSAGEAVALPSLVPSLDAEARLPVRLQNTGSGPLELSKVALSSLNEDGTPKSVWVTVDFGEAGDPAQPTVLPPADTLDFDIVYAPKSLDPNDATLRIVSDDPDDPVFLVMFEGPPLEPRVRVEPPAVVFEEASLTIPEVVTLHVHNDGLTPLAIESVDLGDSPKGYQLLSVPVPGAVIKPLGHPSYAPAAVELSYKPGFGSANDTGSLTIETNDPMQPNLVIPLSSTFETQPDTSGCLFAFPTTTSGKLDLGEVVGGKASALVTIDNAGSTTCTVTSMIASNDPDQVWFTITPAGGWPIVVEPGGQSSLTVTFNSLGFALETELNVAYSDFEPRTLTILVQGVGPEPCIELAPGSLSAPEPLHFAGPQLANVVRHFVVYNCGEGELGLLSLDLTGSVDTLNVLNPIKFYTGVPPHGLLSIGLGMYVPAGGSPPSGELELTWMGLHGPETTTRSLKAILSQDPGLPVAEPGTSLDYAGATVGQPLVLDGSGSAGHTPSPAQSGYLWYVDQRPAGSSLIVNGPPGPPTHTVVPDAPGAYVFALVVKTAGANPLYSEKATVTVEVQPAEDP